MTQGIVLNSRDLAILRLLAETPATAAQIRKASVTFGSEPFRDERRVRERMQALAQGGLLRSWSAAPPSGGLMAYYRLTGEGYRLAFPEAEAGPSRQSLLAIAPSRYRHAMATADAIVHTLTASHERGVRVHRILGDGKLTLEIGERRQQPDFHAQLGFAGLTFNLVFEIDNATEPIDSLREQSIRAKIDGYIAYHEGVLQAWKESGNEGRRPTFRVAFLTTSAERAYHILWLARQRSQNPARRLIYATTQDMYCGHPHAVTEPVFIDHRGHWQALVDPHPTSRFLREPVRLSPPVALNDAF